VIKRLSLLSLMSARARYFCLPPARGVLSAFFKLLFPGMMAAPPSEKNLALQQVLDQEDGAELTTPGQVLGDSGSSGSTQALYGASGPA
jgi:hypothetical protein